MPFKNSYATFDDCECGLVSIGDGFALPLYMEKCSVNVEVCNHIGHYTINQTFANLTDDPVEALYIFPIKEGGVVHYFSAESDGVVVKSIVTEISEGDVDEADLAAEDTRTEFLLSEFKPDFYQITLGMLKANSITEVELRYVCELPVQENSIRCAIPTTVAPQYSAPQDDGPEKTAADQLVDLDKDIDIELTLLLRQSCKFNQLSEGNEIEWKDDEAVDEDGFFKSTGIITIKRMALEEDIVIDVSTINGKSFGARILIEETEKAEMGAMVTLIPEFPPSDFQADMIFLIDKSASMSGRSIEKAKEALMMFLAALPSDCKFNICSFNSSFDFLFDASKQYNDITLAEAREYVDNIIAEGGTSVYEPLETIFKQKVEKGCQKQIFLLTDGHVERAADSEAMVKRNVGSGRVFTLGIGEDASRELVNTLARSGHGTAMFVTYAEDLKDKVMLLLESSLLPVLTDISFSWLSDTKPQKSFLSFFKSGSAEANVRKPIKLPEISAPSPIPHVFSGKLLIVYQSLVFGELPLELRISGNGPSGPLVMVINLDTAKVMKNELLHKLMAIRMVKSMDESDSQPDAKAKQRMINLGTNYNVGNLYCGTNITGQFGEDIPRVEAAKPKEAADVPMFQQLSEAAKPKEAADVPMFQQLSEEHEQIQQCSGPVMQMRMRQQIPDSNAFPGGSSNIAPPPVPRSSMFSGSSKMKKKQIGGSSEYHYQQVSNTRMAKSNLMSNLGDMGNIGNYTVHSAPVQQKISSKGKGMQRDALLMGLVQVQATDGSFKYGDVFMTELGMTEAEIVAEAAKIGCDVEFFTTLIAIIYLRSTMANRKSSWQRSGSKADDYIAANLGDRDLNEIEEKCQQFIDLYIYKSKSNNLFKGYRKK